jgi:hypothetical protein
MRSLQVIAKEIKQDWEKQGRHFPNAATWLNKLRLVGSINSTYYGETGRQIIEGFLHTAQPWQGPTAHHIKLELRQGLAASPPAPLEPPSSD